MIRKMNKMTLMLCLMSVFSMANAQVAINQVRQIVSNEQQSEYADSINSIIQKAQQGDAEAQNEVGIWYFSGINSFEKNDSLAVRWWAKSASQGNVEAVGNLGLCYQLGRGVQADSLRATDLYKLSINKGNRRLFDNHLEWASKGNLFSNVFLAVCYQKGIGTSRDIQKCVQYYKAAANKNSVDAQRELGVLCLTANKPKQAVQFFKPAAEKNDLTSVYYYGQLLFDGNGITKDESTGLIYILKAGEQGFAQAQYILGTLYESGNGVAKDADQAFKWYMKAAEQQHARAQLEVAESYINGIGTFVSYRQALEWYSAAYSHKAKSVIRNLASGEVEGWKDTPFMIYLEGMKNYYVDEDIETAMAKFKELEKCGIIDGVVMQAVVLSDERYKKYDLKKAIKILEENMEIDVFATYLLGMEYESGRTLSKDINRAIELYNFSAEAGFAEAQCRLGDIYYEGRGVDTDYEKAVTFYLMALKQNSLTEESLKRLASCYENGWGNLSVDKRQASELLKNKKIAKIEDVLKLIN